jgi:hypothetical protein
VFQLKAENPAIVGFGLGLTQGFILAAVVSLGILTLHVWSKKWH